MLNIEISKDRQQQLTFLEKTMDKIKSIVGKSAKKMNEEIGREFKKAIIKKINYNDMLYEQREIPNKYKVYYQGSYKMLAKRTGRLIDTLQVYSYYNNTEYNNSISSDSEYALALLYGYRKRNIIARPYVQTSIKNVLDRYDVKNVKIRGLYD